jgi:hypothetical protein
MYFILRQQRKGYFLEKQAYDQFLLSVLKVLQNIEPGRRESLYFECGQVLRGTYRNCKDTEGKKTIVYRGLLFFCQSRDIQRSQIQDELAVCNKLLSGLDGGESSTKRAKVTLL